MSSASLPSVLVVEDTPSMAQLYGAYLEKAGFAATLVGDGAGALAAIEAHAPDVVVLDLHLPDMDGRDILARIVASGATTSVIVVTTDASIKVAVEAMRAGAFDFIVKPFSSDRLVTTVRNAAKRSPSRIESVEVASERTSFQGFIGESAAMKTVYRAIEAAAPSNATIFITGESGSGKELCAEAIHKLSRRGKGPFVAINCGAIPKDLIESELFGHLRGSFTGAVADRPGAVKQADGGTLFLDEIGELQIDLQTKLLRLLQTGAFRPVGASRAEQADLRVICATNRDPAAEVAAGRFREDLYYRLHVIPIGLPPLRARGDDVLLIADALLRKYTAEEQKSFRAFAPSARDALRLFAWPGNVRQLQNVLRNAIVMNEGDTLTDAMLPIPTQIEDMLDSRIAELANMATRAAPDVRLDHSNPNDPATWRDIGDIVPLEDIERVAMERAVSICEGNVPRAAAFLRVSPSTLYRKRQSWEQGNAKVS
jgi:two-component system repressor protein LuxO